MKSANNIVIHNYHNSPYIVKCGVNFRRGKKILFQAAIKNESAAREWIQRIKFDGLPVKIINHR